MTEKRRKIEALLNQGRVYVYLDTRRPGAVVPEKHQGNHILCLSIGRGLQPPIDDLSVTDQEIACTLSFDRVLFHCTLPLDAIWAIGTGDHKSSRVIDAIWPECMPVDRPIHGAKPKPKQSLPN